MTKTHRAVKTVATLGMLSAIAFAATLLSKVFPQVQGFLSFDLKDAVIVMGGFMFGPLAAAGMAAAVSLIEMVTVSHTGWIGLLMNVLQSCSFACVAAAVYRFRRTMRGAVIGLTAGTLTMTAVMLLWNWIITPLYMNVPRDVVAGMLVPVFLPFNLVKGGINATLTLLLYKPVVTALRRAHLLPESEGGPRRTVWPVIVAASCLLAGFTVLALLLAGVL